MTTNAQRRYAEKLTVQIMSDASLAIATLPIRDAWIMLSCIQLAWRDPALSDGFKRALRHIGEQLEQMILIAHPNARMLIKMGWNTDHDTDVLGNTAKRPPAAPPAADMPNQN